MFQPKNSPLQNHFWSFLQPKIFSNCFFFFLAEIIGGRNYCASDGRLGKHCSQNVKVWLCLPFGTWQQSPGQGKPLRQNPLTPKPLCVFVILNLYLCVCQSLFIWKRQTECLWEHREDNPVIWRGEQAMISVVLFESF